MKPCRNILASGTCPIPHCRFDHTVLSCEPCGFIAYDPGHFDWHMTTKSHFATVSGRNRSVHCSLCDANMAAKDWDPHVRGRRHRSTATIAGVSPSIEPEEGVAPGTDEYCPICKFFVKPWLWARHTQGPTHLRKEKFLQYRSVLDEAERDKNGICIEGDGEFGIVPPAEAENGLEADIFLKSTEPLGNSVLVAAKLASRQGGRPHNSGFSIVAATYGQRIYLGRHVLVVVAFEQKYIGRYEDRLELVFEDRQLQKQFYITRPLRAIVGDKADHEALKPVAPYVPRQQTNRIPETTVIEGVAPPSYSLPLASIPPNLLAILRNTTSTAKQLEEIKKLFVPTDFNSDTYARFFKNLLWIEEHRSEADLERYDMTDAPLSQWNQYYYLAIPGLAEKRPSVLVGDRILVQASSTPNPGQWFEGHVHVVRQTEVGLRFHYNFDRLAWSEGRRYNVRFKLSRIILRRMHQAMDSAYAEDRVLFPEWKHVPRGLREEDEADREDRLEDEWRTLHCYNPLIKDNTRQADAVNAIIRQPPGTPEFSPAHLAIPPPTSLPSRLAKTLPASQLFRMYAPSRSKAQVPDSLLSYTYEILSGGHLTGVMAFSVPPIVKLKSFRVVVATCVSASMLAGVGVPRGWYTHIIVDEAGQATEPEVFIPVKTLADVYTNVVLSGDPRQLGPIVRSGVARKLGLEKSWLERLMERKCYDVREGHAITVVKLTKNFRSHPAILKLTMNSHLTSTLLPRAAAQRQTDREASSPSFFNIDEVLQVKAYVRDLKDDRRVRTTDSDIGIIAPYHAQCMRLRTALRPVADGVKVGSVEEFQGQERKVIIMSTVRSSKDFVDYDLRHTLGFVANPRRFNVAVTRAQALLVIVGNPHVLGLDPLWRSFLNYIHRNGGWAGPDIPWDPEEPVNTSGDSATQPPRSRYDRSVRRQAEIDMNEFTKRMEEMTLSGTVAAKREEGAVADAPSGEGEDLDLDANIDRPWTRGE
ncbi:RNA helicase [Ephemerocybe angulata]|uniref:RNA helicase n=1 Tax=Ephemerocybe angulata TaxID=980116 RepID=A0A8H6I482_9AGAR|nr:RNA helicase [Tulosesus angulatus]